MWQTLLTVLLVGASAIYVLWTLLLPAAARRRIAQALLRLHWPDAVAARLRTLAQAKSGCGGCDGCDTRAPEAPAQTMHWIPRRSRRR